MKDEDIIDLGVRYAEGELTDEAFVRAVRQVPMEPLTGRELHKGTGDVMKDLAHAQRFTESIQDQTGGQLGKEIDFVDRALRVAMGEIKRLRQRTAPPPSTPPRKPIACRGCGQVLGPSGHRCPGPLRRWPTLRA